MFLINNKLNSTIELCPIDKNLKEKSEKTKDYKNLIKLHKIIFNNKNKKDLNFNSVFSSDNQLKFDNLLKFYKNKPSDIYIFSIYEIE